MIRPFGIFALTALLIFKPTAAAAESPIDRLSQRLIGNFSSAEQTAQNPTYRHVEFHAVPIWSERTDGHWLYIEQFLAAAPELPYRQRIYQLLSNADGSIKLRIFNLAEPLEFSGAWRDGNRLAALQQLDLIYQEGCDLVMIEREDGAFYGTTDGNGCVSSINGASYATHDLTLTATSLTTWERGYNGLNAQVWGPLSGGYIFKRVE